MIEYNQAELSDFPDRSDFGIKVIGVGGAGANVLDRMALEGSDEAELLTLNTDVRALSTSVSSEKIQLGATLLKGMGTGGDPSLGKQAAIEAVDEIRSAVRNNKMVFVCVGLGGGTGSGAAPEVCRIAREEGVFLVVFATMPFSFEGERRMEQAKRALEHIGRYANAVITFDNDRMGELIVPKDGVTQAFAAADKIISQSIRATMNVVFRPGLIRIGMDDLLAALATDDSRCLFGYGVAKGDNRAHEALEQALKCPLLDRGKLLNEAKAILIQVAGGETMTLYEVQLVMDEISKHVGDSTQILFGTGTDKRLGNSLTVTIISSINGPGASASRAAVEESRETVPSISLGMHADAPPALGQPSPSLETDFNIDDYEEEEIQPVRVPVPLARTQPQFVNDPGPRVETEAPIFEPLQDENFAESTQPLPAYSPEALPPVLRKPELRAFKPPVDEGDDSDLRNPIARAMDAGREPEFNRPPSLGEYDAPELDRVEAVTETSQKITLTRMVSSGNTGRIKTRDPQSTVQDGPAFPPSKPPVIPRDDQAVAFASDEARQQQELLQLEPVGGKGRFAKTDPTIVDGEDLDVPTFLRKKR